MNTLRTAAAFGLSAAIALAVGPPLHAADAPPSPALAATPHPPIPEASIPFARKNIWNWQADAEKGIWVQAIGHQWYYGKFMAPCIDLPFKSGVHFRFGPAGELDKWGAVIVAHFPECVFTSFTLSDGPPSSKKGKPPAGAPTPMAPTSSPSGPAT
jgi:hypothetical protein